MASTFLNRTTATTENSESLSTYVGYAIKGRLYIKSGWVRGHPGARYEVYRKTIWSLVRSWE